MLRVLIACEFSGVVREAFKLLGHDAWSCDILPTEIPGKHIQADVLTILDQDWDLMIAHPPCTYLCSSGSRWWAGKKEEQKQAIRFVKALRKAPIHSIAIENPIGKLTSILGPPNQTIQPWMFGHGETKATCLWLKNLPPLKSTQEVSGRENRIHKMSLGKNRGLERSRTYQGIADAMATQWNYIFNYGQ